MTDDELIRRVTGRPRDQDALDDPRWDRFCRGDLTEVELQELRALAARDPQFAEALEAFCPLGEPAVDRIERLFATGLPEDGRKAKRAASRRRIGLLAVAVPTLAAGILLLVDPGPDPAPPLPTYRLEFEGGEREHRSGAEAATAVPILTQESLFAATLRPDTRVTERMSVIAFLRSEAGWRRIDVAPRVSSSGTLTIVGSVGTVLRADPGENELVLILTRAGDASSLPTDVGELRRVGGSRGRWQVFVQPIRVLPE